MLHSLSSPIGWIRGTFFVVPTSDFALRLATAHHCSSSLHVILALRTITPVDAVRIMKTGRESWTIIG